MAERASVFEKPRFGVEDTANPGAPVAATKILQSLTVEPTPQLPRDPIKAAGKKRPVGVTSRKQWTDLSFSASTAYQDGAYLLNGACCIASVAAISGAAGCSRLTWLQSGDSADTMATYTIEMGSSVGTARVPGVRVTDIAFNFTPKEAKITAKGIGKRYDENITLTANPSNVPLIAISPDTVSVYVADTLAGLDDASARMKRLVSASWGQSGKQGPIFTLDDTEASFSGTVERAFDMAAQIVVEQDSQGLAVMNKMRAKSLFYTRIECIGQDIISGTPYRLRITFISFVSKTQRGDTDDLYTGTFDLEPCEVVDAFGSGKSGHTLIEMDVPTTFASGMATANTALAGYSTSVLTANQANAG